jgi:hypothetical protein
MVFDPGRWKVFGNVVDGRPLRQVAKRFQIVACCLALVAVLGLAAACGSNGAEPATPVVEEPTPTIAPFPNVDTNVPLVEFHSSGRGYSIGYPEGWEVEASPESTGAGTDFFTWQVGAQRIAVLQVTCNPDLLSPEDMMHADASVASRYGGILDVNAAVPVEVGGVEGEQNTYNLSIGGLEVEHVVVYLVHGECGWRIGLSTMGPDTRDEFLPLFERILASFQLS